MNGKTTRVSDRRRQFGGDRNVVPWRRPDPIALTGDSSEAAAFKAPTGSTPKPTGRLAAETKTARFGLAAFLGDRSDRTSGSFDPDSNPLRGELLVLDSPPRDVERFRRKGNSDSRRDFAIPSEPARKPRDGENRSGKENREKTARRQTVRSGSNAAVHPDSRRPSRSRTSAANRNSAIILMPKHRIYTRHNTPGETQARAPPRRVRATNTI